MIGQIGVANSSADPQAAVRNGLDLVERQTTYVEHPRRGFDIQFHQINKSGSAGDETHIRTLLRGLRLSGCRDGCSGVGWSRKFKVFHSEALLMDVCECVGLRR